MGNFCEISKHVLVGGWFRFLGIRPKKKVKDDFHFTFPIKSSPESRRWAICPHLLVSSHFVQRLRQLNAFLGSAAAVTPTGFFI